MTGKTDLNAAVSQASLMDNIIDRLQSIIEEAEEKVKPLEMEPYRGQLFELFVTADGAGLTDDKVEPNLSSESIASLLAERWGLKEEARATFANQEPMSSQGQSRVRLLWSLLRMWMEWTYAWERWPEFHDDSPSTDP